MAILPTFLRHMVLPEIMLCEKVLDYVDSYKYLGYLLSNSGKVDDLEIQHQYRLLCCRANSLIRKFAMCSFPVKKHLYRAYCANVYGVHYCRNRLPPPVPAQTGVRRMCAARSRDARTSQTALAADGRTYPALWWASDSLGDLHGYVRVRLWLGVVSVTP